MKIPMRYFSIIGIILFVVIISQTDIPQLLSIILNSNYLLLILAFLISAIEVVIRSTKFRLLVNIFSKGYKLKDALKTYLIGFAFGAVTPSKTGDLIKIIDLKNKTGMDMKRCFSISVFDRIIDFSNLIFTSILSITIAVILFSDLDHILIPLLLILLALFLSVLFGLTKYSEILLRPFYHLIPGTFKAKAKEIYYSFREIIVIARNSHYFFIYLIINLIAWIVTYFVPYIIAMAIGLDVPLLYFVLLMPIVAVVEVLPITLFGIGSRDLTLILLLSPMGLKKEAIISISMLTLFIGQLPRALAGFLISWKSKKPINTETINKKEKIINTENN